MRAWGIISPLGVAARSRAMMASAALTEICCDTMASTSVSKMLGLGVNLQGPTRTMTSAMIGSMVLRWVTAVVITSLQGVMIVIYDSYAPNYTLHHSNYNTTRARDNSSILLDKG